jgi:site-specific recombinase XerD
VSPKTIDYYRQKLSLIAKCLPLFTTTKPALEDYLGSLNTSPGNKAAYLQALKTFYSWAVDRGYRDTNPALGIKIKLPKPLRYTLSLSNVPCLLDHCSNDLGRLIPG